MSAAGEQGSVTVRLYTAPGCCLCEAMGAQLEDLRAEFPLVVEEINIAGDSELERRFREQIPVLYLNGRKTAKYRLSTAALRQRIERALGRSGRGGWRLR